MKIIDNINSLLGDDLKQSITPRSRLKIAASCFSIFAYESLKKELEKIESLQFIFTAPTFVAEQVTDKFKRERREFFIPKLGRERSLYGSEFEIRLRNELTQKAVARECADWIHRKVQFRSNKTTSPMQSFACLQSNQDIAYMPIQGFTAVDLGYQHGDAVSNIVNKMDEPAISKTYLQLFDTIWDDSGKIEDVTSAVCEHIASIYRENSPELIYFLILSNIFGDFLEDINEDLLPNDRTGYLDTLIWNKLYNFQHDAAIGIINKLETYNGCILADSVGLGKTFTALAVIKYYELRNRSVLVLCPKKIADNWLNYNSNLTTNILAGDRFNYDVLCHTDLSRTFGESFGIPLNRVNWGNYDLVVIDESHNFRNNIAVKDRETRYQKLMNQIVKAGVKTKVLMLSATPVNNRFTDLRNQLALAYEGDSENLSSKLQTDKTVEEIFRNAQAVFNLWSKLPPEERTTRSILEALDFDFFELLDSVTIARSRKHIETFYDTKEIGAFPTRSNPLSFRAPLSMRSDVINFNEIFERLSQLKLSIYAPINYVLPSRLKLYEDMYDTQLGGGRSRLRQADRERSLQALMITNLLKRLESSVEAFRKTLQGLQNNHERTMEIIQAFRTSGNTFIISDGTEVLDGLEAEEDDIPVSPQDSIGKKIKIKLADMDLLSWEHELRADQDIINDLLNEMAKVPSEDDAKLNHLKNLVLKKIENPINPGNKKVLIFTAFADTANYLYAELSGVILTSKGLHTGKVTGTDAPKSTLNKRYDFQSLLTLFSPHSKDKHLVLPNEPRELDILIGTDCISEGQNLQDCDYLINYDIHWNPVRIIQRFGRIDRIGSLNTTIQLVNYWPDISLDEYINLKERVENKMVIADVTATGDDNVLTAKSNDVAYRKEQLRQLQEEVIDLEDLKTGVSITDLGMNDFRMDLLNHVKANGQLTGLPNGLHAVVSADPERGLYPGAVFVLRNRNDSVNINHQNRLHPYYLIAIGEDGHVLADHTQVKKILDLLRSACKGRPESIPAVCDLFNARTDQGRNMQICSDMLNQAIRSMIEVKEEKDLDSLFSGGKTTALVDTIAGLDDFELVAFLVVQEVR